MGAEGMVMTNQRHEILEFLKKERHHPTADDVYREVKEKLPRISKATVYNNLRYLVERGVVEEIYLNGVARFEYSRKGHHHVVCTNCGRVTDIRDEDLGKLSMDRAEKIEGFDIRRVSTTFYGICEDCKSGK